ncbi:MAG: hypothetical protein ACREFP_23445 [Acetobacteraceae bacterium]
MDKQSSVVSTDWPALAAGHEERWRALGEANVRLMRGMLSVWQQELQLGQELMAENLAEPNAVAEFFSGKADGATHWSAAQRRFEKAVTRMRRINDDFYGCLFEAVAMASGNGVEAKKEPAARGH